MPSPTITTSSIQVLDGATDITSGIEWKSFNMTLVLTKEKGGFQFDILAANNPTIPALGDTIYVNYTIDGVTEKIFGGTVISRQQIIDGGILQRYKILCCDWGFKFDSKLVKKTYSNMDPQDIVKDIVSNFAGAGFTTVHVNKGNFNVAKIKFNYQQPTKAIESLAKQIGWDWYIDADKDLHFFFAGTTTGTTEINPAPFDIDDTGGQLEWPTLDILQDLSNMKNSIYVVGGTYTKTYADPPGAGQFSPVDIYKSVAGVFVYPLSYPYDIATMVVKLAGSSQTIGTDQLTPDSSVNVQYSDAGVFIRFTTDPGAGHTIEVLGNAKVPILAHVTNPTAIALYGEYQDSIIDKQILSVIQAQARAQAEIVEFGHPTYDVKFKTISPLSNQLSIGQMIKLNSTKFGIADYLLVIRRIEVAARTPNMLEYSVEALGSDKVTFTDIMLTLLQQQNAGQDTNDSTVLQILIPVDELLEILDTVTITATAGPYVLDPATTTGNSPEGAGEYGAFGLASASIAGGLEYGALANGSTPSPIMILDFSTLG